MSETTEILSDLSSQEEREQDKLKREVDLLRREILLVERENKKLRADVSRSLALLRPVEEIVEPLEARAKQAIETLETDRARIAWLLTANLVVTGIASLANGIAQGTGKPQEELVVAALWALDQTADWWERIDNRDRSMISWAQIIHALWLEVGAPNRPGIRPLSSGKSEN